MKKDATCWFVVILLNISFTGFLQAQKSVLVNFGSNTCTVSTAPGFSVISNPLTVSPSLLASCGLSAQLPDFYSVFIAYNPRNNKVYVADVRSGFETKIWVMDIGLPVNMACPPTIPVAPTYSYSYISNNFEFDNNGDLWSLSGYNATTGQCNMDKFDVNTGQVINTRSLQFPAGNFPTTISSGDLAILPNGRMFATLGSTPSRLYEIIDYSSTTNAASAIFLSLLPANCYGIAFLDGILELTGNDFSTGCYYFDYNISTNVLGPQKNFQLGQSPIDNTSITPSIGCTKRLLSSTRVNANTADLTYEIYTENMGNVILNNINLKDDLAATFGAGNVSNVSSGFAPGSNAAGLIRNLSFNGTTVTDILNPGQNLPNRIFLNRDYYFKIILNCRVTNLDPASTYLNSAIAKANIGAGNAATIVNVSDTSNNGDSTVVDPNKNGNAGDVGENVPTPFQLGVVPVKFINISASITGKVNAMVKWEVATPMVNASSFEVEFSADGRTWYRLGSLQILNANRGKFEFPHINIPVGKIYYRIKQLDNDGTYIYSRVVVLNNKSANNGFLIYPNPATDIIQVTALDNTTQSFIELYDAVGRKLFSKTMTAPSFDINTSYFPNGTYTLRIINKESTTIEKIIIKH
jgi:hypothetical protein